MPAAAGPRDTLPKHPVQVALGAAVTVTVQLETRALQTLAVELVVQKEIAQQT